MTRFLTRGTRTLAVAALMGSAAFATAHATDWDKLQNKSWGGDQASASAESNATGGGSDQMASASADGSAGAEIATAFQSLGMSPARAECYGKVLSEKLSPDDQQDAAELVRTASNGDEVRSAVLNAGPTMVGGFSAADTTCPEGMGG